ncbi:all-trans-retinol 13,14-reductase-like isoform X3 [Patagioenas fasciata]|uniref:all-trans-retinol 13,14-reductase-like isoform X3 n=1 Tax=Patagioenas fasciata TaxID=372321 RepID=UPI003A98F8B8
MWVTLLLLVALGTLALGLVARRLLSPAGNPFAWPPPGPPRPLVTDPRARDKVLKRGFSARRVPAQLDAVVIGSGVGGLAAAGTLARAGKRVLVLEQHDRAGGCTHTFQEQDTEFDVGIHYVGQMHEGSMLRVALDQLTDGQLRWQRLPDPYDEVALGPRRFQLRSGKTAFAAALEEQFPAERAAIAEFMRVSKMASRHVALLAVVKLVPRWVAALLVRTGLIYRISPVFRLAATSHSDAVARLTADPDLRALLSYLFYGTAPRDSSFLVNLLMVHHYQRGAWYPWGGASEIAFHAIAPIERAGGAVLVRAPVTRILVSPTGTAQEGPRRGGGGDLGTPRHLRRRRLQHLQQAAAPRAAQPPRRPRPPGHGAAQHGLLPGVRGAAGQRGRAGAAAHQLLDLPPQRPGQHDDPLRVPEPRRGPRQPGHDVHHLPRRQGPHLRAAAPRPVVHDHPDHGAVRVVPGLGRHPRQAPRPRLPALQTGHRAAAAGAGAAALPTPARKGGVCGGGVAAHQPALPGGSAGGDVRRRARRRPLHPGRGGRHEGRDARQEPLPDRTCSAAGWRGPCTGGCSAPPPSWAACSTWTCCSSRRGSSGACASERHAQLGTAALGTPAAGTRVVGTAPWQRASSQANKP